MKTEPPVWIAMAIMMASAGLLRASAWALIPFYFGLVWLGWSLNRMMR